MQNIPVLVLLGFAGWTLLSLLISVGFYRYFHILSGRAAPNAFPADRVEGSDFYRRSMRAHGNCIENLPIYAAIVIAIVATGAKSATLDLLALLVLAARVLQTTIHISFRQSSAVVSVRFLFYLIQYVCFVWMGILVAAKIMG